MFVAGCRPPYAIDKPPNVVEMHWDNSSVETPLTGNPPPSSITVRWNPATSSFADVKYVAEHDCLAWDKHAEQVHEEQSGANRVTTFVCKGPLVR